MNKPDPLQQPLVHKLCRLARELPQRLNENLAQIGAVVDVVRGPLAKEDHAIEEEVTGLAHIAALLQTPEAEMGNCKKKVI